MKARTAIALVVLFITGRTQAGGVDKAKLRELAQLPSIHMDFGFAFSSISGFHFGENLDHLAEIARLQKRMKGDPSDVERYLLLGRHYGAAKREKEAKEAWSKAAAICRKQVREHPGDMSWLIRLGEALLYNDDGKEGETLLHRAIKEAPNEWRGWLALAWCVDGQSHRAIFGDKPYSWHARGHELIIPELMANKPTEAQIAEMQRLRKEARNYYDRAIELAPHDEVMPYYRRWASNNYHGSIEAGLRTIKGEKVNPMAGPLSPECISDMRQIARLSPDDPKVIGSAMYCEILACVYQNKLEMKDDLSSWAEYLAARNRTLVDVLPEESRTFVRWCRERLEQMTKHPDKATVAAASEALAIWQIGIRIIENGMGAFRPSSSKEENEKARTLLRENLRRTVRLDPSRERAWDSLIVMLEAEEKTDEAITVARQRLEFKDNVRNRLFLAKVYVNSDHLDKAEEELRAALKIDPKDLNCLLGLIALRLKRNDAQSLKETDEQLESVWPRVREQKDSKLERDFFLLRGIHSALIDRPDWAKKAFQQVLQMFRGETTATRALVTLGEPLGLADQQLAIDYIHERSGGIGRKDGQTTSPLELVCLNRDHITDQDLFVLSAFPQLGALDLSLSEITDTGLAQLERLTALRSLKLDDTEITDKGLIHLKALRDLRKISLNETRITDAGLSHLAEVPTLEDVQVVRSSNLENKETITDEGLAHLCLLTELRSISVGSSITDKGLVHLAAIPHLRQLRLLSSKITDAGMKHVERLTELEELWLSDAQITDAGLAHLTSLHRLKKLHLGGTKITDAGLVHLKELSQLEELELDSTAVSDAGLVHLRELTNLRKLNLGDSDRKKTSPTISKKPPLTGEGLKHLQGLTKLKYLDLDGRPITNAGLSDIEKLTQVEYLSLDTTRITDEGLEHLHPLKQLQLVNVKSTKVTRQGVAELRKVLPKLEVYR